MSMEAPFSRGASSGVWKRAVELPGTITNLLTRVRDYSPPQSSLLPGHKLELLINGERAFPRMLEAIGRAQKYVHLETYIWEPDQIGSEFAEALCERARSGVRVRAILDGFGCSSLPWNFIENLKDNRVEVVEYRPLTAIGSWERLRRASRRDHRKTLIIDGRLSFCGGINIGKDYAPVSEGGAGWRDTHLAIRGPATAQLDALFWDTWHACGGRRYKRYPPVGMDSVADNAVLAAAITSDDSGQRSTIRRHYLYAIDHAKESIFIANAYFVPSPQLSSALCKAASRGVEVRILLPHYQHNDVMLVQLASQHVYANLMRAGVSIHWWPVSHMHAKTAVIDGVWSIVGSYNLDAVSLFQNLEVVIEAFGESFGADMVAMFREDFKRSIELEPGTWDDRGTLTKFGENLAYRLRRFL